MNIIEKTYALNFNLKSLIGDDPANANLSRICCDPNSSIVGKVTHLALDFLGLVAFIMIVYASITYLIAYGDESKAEVAKKTLIWSIVGVLVIVFAKYIIGLVYNLIV